VAFGEKITIGEYHPLPKESNLNDPFTSLRQIMKRFAPIKLIDNVSLEPEITSVQTVDYIEKYYGIGTPMILDQMYGLYRGGHRLKLRVTYNGKDTGLTCYIPPPTVMVSFESAANDPATSYILLNEYFSGTVPGTKPTSKTIPVDATIHAGYIEFEIPYAQNNYWTSTRNGSQFNGEKNMFVYIKNNSTVAAIVVSITGFIAGADDLRFCAFQGLRKFTVKTGEAPDRYNAATP